MRGFAALALIALLSCSATLPEQSKPTTPIQHYLVALHGYTQTASGIEALVSVLANRAAAGDTEAFAYIPTAELLAAMSARGRETIEQVDSRVRACTGNSPEQLRTSTSIPVKSGLASCDGLTTFVILATGDLKGLVTQLEPRLAAAKGGL